MKNLLHRRLTVGQKEIDALARQVARSERGGQGVANPHEFGGDISIDVREVRAVPHRHDEKMTNVDRLNVHERGAIGVAIHEAGRQFACQDSAKDAFAHWSAAIAVAT